MPANKDFKHLVRARMQKTGESFTAARLQLLTKKKSAAPSPDYAKLAGMRDAALQANTGHTWAEWVGLLDRVKAHTWPHPEIARHVHETHAVPGWWTQAVTVGYERIKGLRAVGQRRDGGFEANKSKTFALPLTRLFRAFSDRRTREKWLPGVALTVRSTTPGKYMRLNWPDGTLVQLGFSSKGRGKSQVAVQHGKLPDKAAVIRVKEFWAERLARLAEL